MKRDRYQIEIKKIIDTYKAGYAFTSADFIDIANIDAVNKALSRLNENGYIRRIMHSVYDKPIYSKTLNGYNSPDVNNVAFALARKFNWTIAPSGETALNILHLSTQVSNINSYISDGPYRKYRIGKYNLEFKHCANREITGKSLKTIMVIQALKYIGKNSVCDTDFKKIFALLSEEEKKALLVESKTSANWIYSLIKKA